MRSQPRPSEHQARVRNIFSICSSVIGGVAVLAGQALPHTAGHDLEPGPVQGAGHRRELGHHLGAVPPGLDHGDDPGQLALRAAEPVEHLAHGVDRQFLSCLPGGSAQNTLQGICGKSRRRRPRRPAGGNPAESRGLRRAPSRPDHRPAGPACANSSSTVARRPEAATRRPWRDRQNAPISPGDITLRAGSSGSGMCSAPATWPSAHSSPRRTSSTVTGRWCRRAASSVKARHRERPAADRRPIPAGAGGRAREPVDADPGQVPLRRGDLFRAVAEQGQRGAPRDKPAEVAREVGAVLEAQSDPVTCPAANARRLRRSTTHSPALIRAASWAGPATAGGDRSAAPGPAALAGPMWA